MTAWTLTERPTRIIPHVFGRERPIVIDNIDRLKKVTNGNALADGVTHSDVLSLTRNSNSSMRSATWCVPVFLHLSAHR